MIRRSKPLKRTALKPATLEQVAAWNERPRQPIGQGAPPRKLGRRARREEAALAHGRAQTIARSGGFCEAGPIDVDHPGDRHGAVHVHHLLPRGRGGNHDPSNLLHVCSAAHAWIHANPTEALALGLLRSGASQVRPTADSLWPW